MQPGDLVRIVTQPKDLQPHIVGEVGLVEETLEDFVYFQGIHEDGSYSGGGCVPVTCLEPESSEIWVRAKQLFLDKRAKYKAENEAHQKRYSAFLVDIATKHGLSKEQLLAIRNDLAAWPE